MIIKGGLQYINESAIQPLLSWVYPPTCLLCNATLWNHSEFICENCWSSLPRAHDDSLERLWLVRENKEVFLNGYFAIFEFNESVQRLIHEFKYEKKTKLSHEIIKQFIPDLLRCSEITSCNWIIPIPLHRKRQRKRGFNQSYLISKELSRYLNIPTTDKILQRNRNTQSQTYLEAEDRLSNVSAAFSVRNAERINNASIILVDDLITTGATVNECAKVLINSGAKKVFALALAHPY